MIRSFKDRETERVFHRIRSAKLPGHIQPAALRKLRMLHRSQNLADLRVPPANRLEALKGDRRGQHSIRINDQFRLCFVWTEAGPEEVEIVARHFAYLKDLTEKGTMILMGRTQNADESTFGIAIFEAENEAAAQNIMANDPAVSEGIMTATLYPYKIALMRS